MKYYPREISGTGSNRITQDKIDGKYYATSNYFDGIGFDTEEEAQNFIDEVLSKRDYIQKGEITYEVEFAK
mgnify:FL=1|jgi:hypothetical protein